LSLGRRRVPAPLGPPPAATCDRPFAGILFRMADRPAAPAQRNADAAKAQQDAANKQAQVLARGYANRTIGIPADLGLDRRACRLPAKAGRGAGMTQVQQAPCQRSMKPKAARLVERGYLL
jgi:hypothetical protein